MDELRYYEIAAQLIPILFVALVFERRFFEDPEDGKFKNALSDVYAVGLFVTGEIYALLAIATGTTGIPYIVLVSFPLILGGGALIWPIVVPRVAYAWRQAGTEWRPRWLDYLLVVGVAGMSFAMLAGVGLFLILAAVLDRL